MIKEFIVKRYVFNFVEKICTVVILLRACTEFNLWEYIYFFCLQTFDAFRGLSRYISLCVFYW